MKMQTQQINRTSHAIAPAWHKHLRAELVRPVILHILTLLVHARRQIKAFQPFLPPSLLSPRVIIINRHSLPQAFQKRRIASTSKREIERLAGDADGPGRQGALTVQDVGGGEGVISHSHVGPSTCGGCLVFVFKNILFILDTSFLGLVLYAGNR